LTRVVLDIVCQRSNGAPGWNAGASKIYRKWVEDTVAYVTSRGAAPGWLFHIRYISVSALLESISMTKAKKKLDSENAQRRRRHRRTA